MPSKIPAHTQQQVRQRANFLCEYCHSGESWQYVPFTFDHLLPKTKGGDEALEKLALACAYCNRRKSDKQFALDPLSGQDVLIFNPRQHKWAEHFIWSAGGKRIMPLIAIGRATESMLNLNRERAIRIRAADIAVKRHPPQDDPVQLA